MTEEEFFTSYAKGFDEETLLKIDEVSISLREALEQDNFFREDDGGAYLSVQAITDARACAEELIRLTDGWTVTDEDIANGFKRFEGKTIKLK